MQKLRELLRLNPAIWVSCLVTALLITLSTQLHLHVHAEHLHDSNASHHIHQGWMHKAHFGSAHDAAHGSNVHHTDIETTAVDISPEGLGKYFSSVLPAIALTTGIILFYSPPLQPQRLKHRNDDAPLSHWGKGLPPQLRAPPL